MGSPVSARCQVVIDKRTGEVDRLVVVVDRELKSGKLDFYDLTPEQAHHLAMELLVAADRFERRRVTPIIREGGS